MGSVIVLLVIYVGAGMLALGGLLVILKIIEGFINMFKDDM